MEKFCLNWSGFNENIRESFRKIREDRLFSDVTLVTDDGQQIQAHKIILSAGSRVFNDIFMKSNHSNMLVYLKGINSLKLGPVIDFIYDGEVLIGQEELEMFIETGKELQVKGLDGEFTEVGEKLSSKPTYSPKKELMSDEFVSADDNKETVTKTDVENFQLRKNNELSLQTNEMIEKDSNMWRCKLCAKTANTKQHIQFHAETHIEGMSHGCHICSKTFTNKNNLNTHVSYIHSELFSCEICEKAGMNRQAYRNHKRSKHT